MPDGATPSASGVAPREHPDFSADPHARLDFALAQAERALLALQHADGYWSFELEADCTIPAEYLLMQHFTGEIDSALQAKIAVYLRARQGAHGGWPLYYGGDFDMSCSVKAYYALKLAGDAPDAPHMTEARRAILARGGAARCNVFTRITLALFSQIPWRGVPFMPVEIVLLPRWFPFHISKVAYWSRTVMVPLLLLCTLKPKAKNPQAVAIRELFSTAPTEEHDYFPIRSRLNWAFLALSKAGSLLEPLIPSPVRRRAIKKAECWIVERLNGEYGLGAIFPAMVNAYEALICLGYPPTHPHRAMAKQALDDLLIVHDDSAHCQPCTSPIWDTALVALALQEIDGATAQAAARRGLNWLLDKQLSDAPGDWRDRRPHLSGGGWPFQFQNSHYPDLDDTAAVAWALDKAQAAEYSAAVLRAADWICGMQSRNGGFASFDVDNTHYYLNEIPFADHGALLDPPSADVSARCATLLARRIHDNAHYRAALSACLAYLRREQEADGKWFGRWGTNYIYGTWSVLTALEQVSVPAQDPAVQRAVAWLKRVQHPDGGWGESNDSYFRPDQAGTGPASTSFQTAWAMLGLLAAKERATPELQRGADYLLRMQRPDGLWHDDEFTAPGFPRVFYLKYHGYDKYFPLWALARYRNSLRQPE